MIGRKKTTHYMHPEKHIIKNSSIETPSWLAYQIYTIIESSRENFKNMVDVGCGKGNLSFPFNLANYRCYGIDNRKVKYHSKFLKTNFFGTVLGSFFEKKYDLILCNPPFNDEKKEYGRKLMPELFLRKIFELWGEKAKVVLFVPMGFRLNCRYEADRLKWLRKDCKAKITSILSLPVNTFKGVLFHSEILFWNIKGIKSHYFANKELYINER